MAVARPVTPVNLQPIPAMAVMSIPRQRSHPNIVRKVFQISRTVLNVTFPEINTMATAEIMTMTID
ncbi:hypothetical protein MASR2M66_21170 [Chloroflexota bacterium]